MKQILLSILALSTAFSTQAQEEVEMGANYANQVFYSLANGVVSTAPVDNWDLAFQTSPQGSVIRINGGYGAELSLYDGALADFSTLDTTGFSTWTKLYGADTSWSKGAFNQFETSDFDLGWGMYDMITHQVKGDSIYVLKTIDGAYKKLYIEKLSGGTYHMIHSDLDNGNIDTAKVAKADYATKNFVYYSFETDEVIDREPASDSWDITFTKYLTELYPGTMYSVTGVLANTGILSAQAEGAPANDLTLGDKTLETNVAIIGYDWKSFNMSTFSYEISDSLAYFIETPDQTLYKIVFTDFGGSADGKFEFTLEEVIATGVEETQLALNTYPNPTQGAIHTNVQTGNATVFSTSGSVAINTSITNGEIDLSGLESGIYIIQIETDNSLYSTTITKQ